jgi:hypothetical protein
MLRVGLKILGGAVWQEPLPQSPGRLPRDAHPQGTRSGIEVDQRMAFLYDLRPDRKIIRARLFPDLATAISVAKSSASQPA